MKVLRLFTMATFVTIFFTQCAKDVMNDSANVAAADSLKHGKIPAGKGYTVTVENVSTNYMFFESGVASIPQGASEAGPALPGHSFQFSFHAGPNHKLSFATMYGWSNDGFYAPDGNGISLYSGGNPVTGDITPQVMLWDAGTEMNQMPGSGNMHDGANTTDAVQLMSSVGDGFDYGMVNTNLKVTLAYDGNHMFTVTVDNLSGSTTPISPVVWVVHTTVNPLFEAGQPDYGHGLENVAETGDASMLGDYLAMNSRYVSPVAPVLWVIHKKGDMPIFTANTPDYGQGLEQLAEMGDPSILYNSLKGTYHTGFDNMPDGANSAGPLFPGDKYTFSFNALPGRYLSIATMLGNSNDLFFAFGESGIRLPLHYGTKDITDQVMLWDAGTEVNEYPGTKSADTVEGGNVRLVNDGFTYPAVNQMIKVTIRKNRGIPYHPNPWHYRGPYQRRHHRGR